MAVVFLAIGCGGVVKGAGGNGGMGGSGEMSSGARGSGGTAGEGGHGGSAPPAQAAVTYSMTPAPGKTCADTSPQLSFPAKYNASVQAELACDLSMGCKPDDYVVVEGDRGASVFCSVVATANGFDVQLSLSVDGSATGDLSGQFDLTGAVSKTGGTVSINASNSYANGGGTESDCTLTIASPHGVIAEGKIWGSVECPNFRDPQDIGDTGCILSGVLLFDNCTH
jgi:hypothetical protein